MNDENFSHQERKHRRGVFFPLLLLGAGVLLLLSNFGLLPGGFWSFVSLYWPALLILSGIDGLIKGEGIAGSLLFAGFGAVILAGNLGYISVSPMELMLKAWPLLLIGIGLDIIIGRRTFARVILGLVLTAGLLYGLVWLSGVNGSKGEQEQNFRQPYQSERNLDLNIERINGVVAVSGFTNSETLVAGTFNQRSNDTITPEVEVSKTRAIVNINDVDHRVINPMPSASSLEWKVTINQKPALDLNSKVIFGENQIDVRGLNIEKMEIETTIGRSMVTIGDARNTEIFIKGAIGDIVVYVPKGAAVRLELNKAISVSQVPDSYEHQGNEFTSPSYDLGESFTNISANLPIGAIQVIEYSP